MNSIIGLEKIYFCKIVCCDGKLTNVAEAPFFRPGLSLMPPHANSIRTTKTKMNLKMKSRRKTY